jgi:hypothetical protein
MMVVSESNGARIAIHVDPGRPGAWRGEPFYSEIKRWAYQAAAELHQVLVCIGRRSIVILPDQEVDLGIVADDELIITHEVFSQGRMRLEALKLKADDPRIAGLEPGKLVFRGPAPL